MVFENILNSLKKKLLWSNVDYDKKQQFIDGKSYYTIFFSNYG